MGGNGHDDRRRFPRVSAPILARPLGLLEHVRARSVCDVSHGGMRTYADEPLPRGRRLEVELFFDGGGSGTFLVQVAWCAPLPAGSPARHEIGFEILQAGPEDLARLERALEAGAAGRDGPGRT